MPSGPYICMDQAETHRRRTVDYIHVSHTRVICTCHMLVSYARVICAYHMHVSYKRMKHYYTNVL